MTEFELKRRTEGGALAVLTLKCVEKDKEIERLLDECLALQDKIYLREIDVKEWRETFAPYGKTPCACLFTLLLASDARKREE